MEGFNIETISICQKLYQFLDFFKIFDNHLLTLIPGWVNLDSNPYLGLPTFVFLKLGFS